MNTKCILAVLLVAVAVALLAPSASADDGGCQVKVSGTLSTDAVAVFTSGGEETGVRIADRVISTILEPGEYTLSVRSPDGTVYNEREVVLGGMATFRFFTTKLCAGNSGWSYGKDYTSDVILNNGRTSFVPVGVDGSGVEIVANVGDVADVTAVPSKDTVAKGFCPVHRTITMSTVKSVYKYVLPAADDFRLTVPSGSSVSLGMKAYDVKAPFQIEPFAMEDDGERATYTYRLIVGYTYGYRVSCDGFADRCCVLMMKAGLSDEVTMDEISSLSSDASVKGDGESGMLLNINPEGFLRMDEGESFVLDPQRITYTDDDAKYGMFLSPSFHFQAISPDGAPSGAVSFDGNVMRAVSAGTAFVLVTYDAVHASYLNMPDMKDKPLYAGSGKGTGVFVVTVGYGAGDDMGVRIRSDNVSGREYGDHFDSDLDLVYYAEEVKHGSIYIDPSFSGSSSVFNPVYSDGKLAGFAEKETVSSGSCRAEVVEGPNVVRAMTSTGVSYQVVRASPVKVTVTDLDRGSYDLFLPGDEIRISVVGMRAPASSQFYGADAAIMLTLYGKTYYSDADGLFETIRIPADASGEGIPMSMKVVCSGCCPVFGSHRTGSDGLKSEERSSDFGSFTLKRYFLSQYHDIYLDTGAESDWDTYASADAGAQGKTVDIGSFEVVAGKRLYLSLDRTSAQPMFGAKKITGADGWLTCDTLSSTADRVLMVAEPGSEDVGDHRFTIVLKLLNNQGTMKTTVTGKITVLETRTVAHLKCIYGKSLALPGIPEGTPVPEGKEFKSWNTEPDGSGTGYLAGKKLAPKGDVRLYAQYGSLDVGSTFLDDGLYFTVTALDGSAGTATVTGCVDSYGTELVIPGTVEYGDVVYTVDAIGARAFYANSTITTADLTAVKTVGYKAFPYCRDLRSLKVSGDIGGYSFYSCGKLSELVIVGDSSIGKSAFSECKSLSDVTFPENLSISKNAFYKCTFKSEDGTKMSYGELAGHRFIGEMGILKMYISEKDEVFEYDGLLYKVVSRKEAALIGSSESLITALIVPDSVRHLGFDYAVTQIGTKAFYKHVGLVSVDLGDVDDIGIKAFAKCTSLESVDLTGVRTIGAYAFYGCDSLRSAEFSDGVSLGTSAFYRCMGLESIVFKSVSSMGGNVFYGWVFWDPATGKRLPVTAESLSDSTFGSAASKMVRI